MGISQNEGGRHIETHASHGLGREAWGFGDPEGHSLNFEESFLKQHYPHMGGQAPRSFILKSWYPPPSDPQVTTVNPCGFKAKLRLRCKDRDQQVKSWGRARPQVTGGEAQRATE